MPTIYDIAGTPRFYTDDLGGSVVFEHGTGRAIGHVAVLMDAADIGHHANPGNVHLTLDEIERLLDTAARGSYGTCWIDGYALHPSLTGQRFYFDAQALAEELRHNIR